LISSIFSRARLPLLSIDNYLIIKGNVRLLLNLQAISEPKDLNMKGFPSSLTTMELGSKFYQRIFGRGALNLEELHYRIILKI